MYYSVLYFLFLLDFARIKKRDLLFPKSPKELDERKSGENLKLSTVKIASPFSVQFFQSSENLLLISLSFT